MASGRHHAKLLFCIGMPSMSPSHSRHAPAAPPLSLLAGFAVGGLLGFAAGRHSAATSSSPAGSPVAGDAPAASAADSAASAVSPSRRSDPLSIHADLHRIALQTGTDKATRHQFTLFYPFFLEHLRQSAFDMLEIGVFQEQSLQMWDRYLPRATVFGADKKAYTSPRILRLDQGSRADLRRVARLRNWSVVLDDGSHKPSHQLRTFREFFPRLPPGGVYIIEDIETNYWARASGMGLKPYGWTMSDETEETDMVELFRAAVHRVLNREFQCWRDAPVFSGALDAMIGSVYFVRNAVVVTKAPREYVDTRNRGRAHYRFRFLQNCSEERWWRRGRKLQARPDGGERVRQPSAVPFAARPRLSSLERVKAPTSPPVEV